MSTTTSWSGVCWNYVVPQDVFYYFYGCFSSKSLFRKIKTIEGPLTKNKLLRDPSSSGMEGQGHKGHGMHGTCTTWLARTSGRRKWLLRRNTWRRLDLSTRWQGGGGSPRDLPWPGAVVRHDAELVTPCCGGGGASIWWAIPLAEKNRWEEVQASVSTWNILRDRLLGGCENCVQKEENYSEHTSTW